MDSQRRRSAVQEDMDHDGENEFVDDASTLDDDSSGDDLPTQERSVDYGAMDSVQEHRGQLRVDARRREPLGNQRAPNLVSVGQPRLGGERGRTYTNPNGMASRSVMHRRSSPHPARPQSGAGGLHDSSIHGAGSTACHQQQKRRRKNSTWTDAALKAAIDAVDGGTSMNAAAKEFVIPYSTLREWCYGVRSSRQRGPDPTLNAVEEQQIVDYLVAM